MKEYLYEVVETGPNIVKIIADSKEEADKLANDLDFDEVVSKFDSFHSRYVPNSVKFIREKDIDKEYRILLPVTYTSECVIYAQSEEEALEKFNALSSKQIKEDYEIDIYNYRYDKSQIEVFEVEVEE